MCRRTYLGLGIVVILCCLVSSGCGGDGPSGPQAPQVTVVAEGNFTVGTILTAILTGDLCGFAESVSFSTNATGTLDVSVDWTSSANDIDIAIMRGGCNCQQLQNDTCNTVAESTSTTAKPERLNISNHPAGSYTLVVANWGDNSESGSYRITLTR